MKRMRTSNRQALDKGQYGQVFYEPNERCAIKTMDVNELKPQTVGISSNTFAEWNAMSMLKCRRVAKDDVELLDLNKTTVSLNLNTLSLWMPFCRQGNLFVVLRRMRWQRDLSSYIKGLILGFECTRSLIRGLSNLEQMGMIHRDVKTTNLVVEGRSGILIDLGMVTNLHADPDTMWASPTALLYKAPELLTGDATTYGHEIDVWSVGILIFHVMSLDEAAFYQHDQKFDDQEAEVANAIADRMSLSDKEFKHHFDSIPRYDKRYNPYQTKLKSLRTDFDVPQVVFDMLKKCLIMDPEERRKTTYEQLEVMIDNVLMNLNELCIEQQ